ncbi:hypothetical protein CHLRE_12g547150v5 [Chlamydomonas reinhardtii]|uniref:Uncharacterized protein n=1 Tax=Chlamydomonas reinhardtii TaxID=3055 RepID=A0A2K3D6H0_CHLRE|nr:uncharacterized protein CHLRE_12g547150v5 [Chlamydomonas reinhardtii]PNW76117.1 hypothetical protein CHLRE_12g547150v5 [Chlamydomonas reinhardtii]
MRQLLGAHGVIELSADEACPDCVFIEDCSLVINERHVIITRPGAPSRQPETGPVEAALRGLGFDRVDRLEAPATLDGGDVQIMPWGVLVGTSRRTNDEAVAQLRKLLAAAGGPPVFAFSVSQAAAAAGDGAAATLHFKSVLSALDPHTLLVADTPLGRALADQIAAAVPSQPDQTAIKPDQAPQPQPPQPQQPYLALEFVPDTIAANVLSLNEHVVTQAGHPASQARIAELCAARGLTLHTLGMAELAKADGALTCCSLLFKGPPGRMEETEEGKQGR